MSRKLTKEELKELMEHPRKLTDEEAENLLYTIEMD